MLTQMNHPCVLRVLGFCTKPAEENEDGQEHKYIVTEFAPNGSLENVIDGAEKIAKIIQDTGSGAIPMPFTKLQALEWALQISSGMAFLKEENFNTRMNSLPCVWYPGNKYNSSFQFNIIQHTWYSRPMGNPYTR